MGHIWMLLPQEYEKDNNGSALHDREFVSEAILDLVAKVRDMYDHPSICWFPTVQ